MELPNLSASPRVKRAFEEALDAALPDMDGIDPDERLGADAGLDSVQIMGLIMEIEDRLDLSIPVELLAEVESLNELAARLDDRLREAEA